MVKKLWLLLLVILGVSGGWLWFLYSNDTLKEERYKKYRKIFIINLIIVEVLLLILFYEVEAGHSDGMVRLLIVLIFLLTLPYSVLIESDKGLKIFLEALSGSREALRKVFLCLFIILFVVSIWMAVVASTIPAKGEIEGIVKEHIRRFGYNVEDVNVSWWGQYIWKVISFDITGEVIVGFEGKSVDGYYAVFKRGGKKEKVEIRIYDGDRVIRYRWEVGINERKATLEYISWKEVDGKMVRESEGWEVDPDSGRKIRMFFKGVIK